MVTEHPVLWVTCDANGNWVRITNKLRLNNLRFEGSKVPSPNAAAGAVSELIASLQCENLGVDPSFSLDKALSYSSLMKKLEGLGLIAPSPPKIKVKVSDKVQENIKHLKKGMLY